MEIVLPETPKEAMELLSRTWSGSAYDMSKDTSHHHKHFQIHNNPSSPTFSDPNSYFLEMDNHKTVKNGHSRRMGGIAKWFHIHHHNESTHKKDRTRADNAHLHTVLSIASLATALASVVAAAAADNSTAKLSCEVASASELLASHCIEVAEQCGAQNDLVSLAVRSAFGVRSPGDLMTMTAAAATALRAEATLRSRIPKDNPKRNASIRPYEKGDNHSMDSFQSEKKQDEFPCIGELLHQTNKGGLRWKQVSIYVNKKAQVIIKLKSKHIGGAFSKKHKCLVHGVCDDISVWVFRKDERDNMDGYFRVKTGHGFLEFKCKTKAHKEQWVYGIQSMLHRVGSVADVITLKC